MENKQTAPKEIWVTRLEDFQSKNHIEGRGILTLNKVYLDSTKYLSSTHVKELLSDKDKEIERLKKDIQALKSQSISVKIALCEDAMSPNIQCLMFYNDNGGYRLTKTKGCGRWNDIKVFDCSFTLENLENYLTKPNP